MFFKKTVLVIGFDARTVDFLVEHKRLTKIGVKMLAESLNELHDNSECCEFRKLVVSELATHDGV